MCERPLRSCVVWLTSERWQLEDELEATRSEIQRLKRCGDLRPAFLGGESYWDMCPVEK